MNEATLRSTKSTSSKPLSITNTNDGLVRLFPFMTSIARIVAYFGVIGFLMILVLIILKYIRESSEEQRLVEEGSRAMAMETSPLAKSASFTYGTCSADMEAGNCSSSSSSIEDSYDGNICVICYAEERKCFFVPCGHCATCHQCALRIFKEESKACPVCRRRIGKIRKLVAA